MRSNSRTKNSFLNFITGFGGQIVQVLIKFVTRTIFISVLGSAYLGINGLFSDILTLLSITELGFDTAINYKLYKPLAQKDTKRLRALVGFYRTVYIVVGIVIFVLGIILIPFLKFLIKDYDSLAKLGINATLIFLLYLFQSASSYWFSAYKSAIVRADEKGYLLNLAQIIITIVSNIAQIVVLLLSKNFILYTATCIFFTIFTNLVFAVIANKLYPDVLARGSERLDREEIIDIFKDCGATFLYKINGVVTRATDNLVMSSFIGLVIVGIYSNYLLVYNTINTLLNRFYEACKASLGNLFAVSEIEKRYFFFEVMNYLTFILYGTACIGIAAISNEFIELWIGNEYLISQPVPVLIGFVILFSGIRNNLGQIRNVTGAFRQMWYRPLLGIIINLAVSIGLVQICGLSGVLIGTIVSNLATNFLVDPIVIHKYSFNEYQPVSRFYKKNMGYFMVLIVSLLLNLVFVKFITFSSGLLSLVLHFVFCAITVPGMYLAVYWKSETCMYLRNKAKLIIRHRRV